ncbi:hypothetical protein DU002_18645 [Corallincola holothuriorum]|uniref:Uncharacterized protein n=1 Tax=Corallincola holothuriorum TaxID=2282215 RepID=A0A368MZE5_9GAMM|nr:hypothetical protein [Corallincola holothuriorum]RCU43290.1 hypothetical protein DU002_18645 [Corallincola holothuriorum]
MKLVSVIARTKPLCFDLAGNLLLSKSHRVYIKTVSGKLSFLFGFKESKLNKLLSFFPLWFRMKRLGVMAAISSGDDFFFTHGRKIYRYNMEHRLLSEELVFTQGRGPLKFCEVKGIPGFSDSICFGEYFGNHERKSIKIFQRKIDGAWLSPFKFENGEINHVHALIPDVTNECIWILTGDFEHSAAIYQARNDFQDVELILGGEQKFRSCVAFPVSNGILYATDTQMENNSIRLLTQKQGQWVSEKLFDINGSCIYGCEIKDFYIFSTSTEPSEKRKGFLRKLFDNKPASGILENKSDILSVRKSDFDFKLVASVNKDVWPYRLFQFGTIMFPSNSDNSNRLYAYNVGSKSNDLSTECYDLSE